ncbi:SIR2 family protein [Leptospira stimsonii]|uniref:Uncharacterized protein n=1 Tax=Leptospira stimsonii TaxID=2202203 RepID=A0A396YRE0_9LEPT|nr:SIR2 family protein [Leptospira stimsonii]RHX83914.1 hypothetical protein DLM75_23505 [Leptospira stimsonii]
MIDEVFILGAGFSHSYCKDLMPLTDDLVNFVLFDHGNSEKREFYRLTEFIKDFFSPDSEKVNFEKLATFLLSNPFQSSGETVETYRELYIDLLSLIADIYGNPTIHEKEDGFENRKILEKFSKRIKESETPIISFNYDTIIEHFLLKDDDWDLATGYSLPVYDFFTNEKHNRDLRKNNNTRLLKLHGSLNWGIPPEEIYNQTVEKIYLSKYQPDMPIHENYISGYFNEPYKLYPFIIPPVSGKTYQSKIIRNLWHQAKYAIMTAKQIHIIGYSLPESDTLVEFLFRAGAGIPPEPNRKKIRVVAPSFTEIQKLRIEKVFQTEKHEHDIQFVNMDAMEYLSTFEN